MCIRSVLRKRFRLTHLSLFAFFFHLPARDRQPSHDIAGMERRNEATAATDDAATAPETRQDRQEHYIGTAVAPPPRCLTPAARGARHGAVLRRRDLREATELEPITASSSSSSHSTREPRPSSAPNAEPSPYESPMAPLRCWRFFQVLWRRHVSCLVVQRAARDHFGMSMFMIMSMSSDFCWLCFISHDGSGQW